MTETIMTFIFFSGFITGVAAFFALNGFFRGKKERLQWKRLFSKVNELCYKTEVVKNLQKQLSNQVMGQPPKLPAPKKESKFKDIPQVQPLPVSETYKPYGWRE